jgi:hypothetical protein
LDDGIREREERERYPDEIVNVINSVDCDVIFVFSFVSPEY